MSIDSGQSYFERAHIAPLSYSQSLLTRNSLGISQQTRYAVRALQYDLLKTCDATKVEKTSTEGDLGYCGGGGKVSEDDNEYVSEVYLTQRDSIDCQQ